MTVTDSDETPNDPQRRLIEATEGIYLVDAGAGTGKTFTLVRRYARILSMPDVEPSDVLLLTFTNNAAAEMRNRALSHCDYSPVELQNAPISTFHAFCRRILARHGYRAPAALGIDDYYTSAVDVLENDLIERRHFRTFTHHFRERHPEHGPFFRVTRQVTDLLGLIRSLAAKGIIPTRDGWYQKGEDYLEGNLNAFLRRFEAANERRGNRQSELRSSLNGYGKNHLFLDDAPTREEIRGEGKQVPSRWAEEAFREDREDLKAFVHDLYREYVAYALQHHYVNFGFLQMLAYVLLCEEPSVRERYRHRYVMVDEFQDTSEIQFKLALLLAGAPNLCAVGDWKQSIYGFRHASVENIQRFRERLGRYRGELNEAAERIPFPVEDIQQHDLKHNYRSTQPILDLAEEALVQPGKKNERLNEAAIRNRIVHLESRRDHPHSRIRGIVSPDEPRAILQRIQTLVNDDGHVIPAEDGGTRPIEYGDVAVLSRKIDFALDLERTAREHNLPVAYEGGLELLKTNPALRVLAWLRVLNDPYSKRGWSVILEDAGYWLEEVRACLPDRDDPREPAETVPDDLWRFRHELEQLAGVGTTCRTILNRYGEVGPVADEIVHVLSGTLQDHALNLGELIRFIEDAIEEGAKFEVDSTFPEDAAAIKTIHKAKGLEFPVVFVAGMNRGAFPAAGGGKGSIDYREPIGLRQSKIDAEDFVYDNWRSQLLNKSLSGEYDEERRLLYVAMTRAESRLYLTAEKGRAGRFFEGMREHLEVETIENPSVEPRSPREEPAEPFRFELPDAERSTTVRAHDLLDESIFEAVEGGRGKKVGESVHEFAEAYVHDPTLDPEPPAVDDKRTVMAFLDGLEGEVRSEVSCLLPLDVEGRRITLSGTIDLLHVTGDTVDVVDFKTDTSTHALEEYAKQLSSYVHVIREVYPDRTVRASLFYTHLDELKPIDPLSREELEDLLA